MNAEILTLVVPCFNEEKTLKQCIETVLKIENEELKLEIIIVDDASTDRSRDICNDLARKHQQIQVLFHESNQGKGAALRTGFKAASGDFVAVQDADLEYDPQDLIRLIKPLRQNKAEVVLGSRFRSGGASRVLYFWHSMGNKFLTLLSNMFTDLNLSDMETCYKVFKREIIQSIEIEENRFGFEPEVVAKISELRCRIYEMGISYHGRTYAEGKKIGIRDGFRALYCIFRYNAHKAPIPIQFFFYLFIGGVSAIFNLLIFLSLRFTSIPILQSTAIAFSAAAFINYWLCTKTLFRRKAFWGTTTEAIVYVCVVLSVGIVDAFITNYMITNSSTPEWLAKIAATSVGLILNFAGRRSIVFREKPRGPWKPQNQH